MVPKSSAIFWPMSMLSTSSCAAPTTVLIAETVASVAAFIPSAGPPSGDPSGLSISILTPNAAFALFITVSARPIKATRLSIIGAKKLFILVIAVGICLNPSSKTPPTAWLTATAPSLSVPKN